MIALKDSNSFRETTSSTSYTGIFWNMYAPENVNNVKKLS